MKTNFLRLSVYVFFFFAVSFSSQAQEHSRDAKLTGTLRDPSGAGVGGVKVEARLEGDARARAWSTESGTDGTFALALAPGRYRVTFTRAPFSPREFLVELATSEQRQ